MAIIAKNLYYIDHYPRRYEDKSNSVYLCKYVGSLDDPIAEIKDRIISEIGKEYKRRYHHYYQVGLMYFEQIHYGIYAVVKVDKNTNKEALYKSLGFKEELA